MINQKIDFSTISTIDEAMFYGHTFTLYYYNFTKNHTEEVYFLRLAKMMRELGRLRLAGKCYKMALRFSVQNQWRSYHYGTFKSATRPEKVYRILVHFYTDLGSTSHIKELRKLYDKLLLDDYLDHTWYYVQKEYNAKVAFNKMVDSCLSID